MAARAENFKSSSHIRSASFPSGSHPLNTSVEEQLERLRSTEGSSSASSTCQKLEGLKLLYDSVNDWLQLSLTQQALSNENQRENIEDLLDGSLRTMDFCGTVRDVLSQMKECAHNLESSLRRRRRGDNSTLATEISAYIASRKKMNKAICKSFENLRGLEKTTSLNKCKTGDAAVSMAMEVEEISISVFKSLSSFLSRPKSRSNGWSLVSKLLSSKRISCQDVADANEVEELEAELVAVISGKDSNIQLHNVLKRLEALESSIQEIEEAVECVFRGLLKSRVSLLNILNH